MDVELVDVGSPEARALVKMDETPLPGDEVQLGIGGPLLRAVRRRYVFDETGQLNHVRVSFRSVGESE